MSTKIYHAWRIPSGRLNAFIDRTRSQLIPPAVAHIVELMSLAVKDEDLGPEPEWLLGSPRGYERAKIAWRAARRYDIIEALAKADAKSPYRSHIDVQCWLNVWLHSDGNAYVIPIAENWMLKLIKPPRWAADFSYWNNTDMPEGVSYKSWEARGAVWDRLCLGQGKSDHNARRLSHAIIEVGNYGYGYDFGLAARELYESNALKMAKPSEAAPAKALRVDGDLARVQTMPENKNWPKIYTQLSSKLESFGKNKGSPLTKAEARATAELLKHMKQFVGPNIPSCPVCKDERTVAVGPGGFGRCPARCRGEAT